MQKRLIAIFFFTLCNYENNGERTKEGHASFIIILRFMRTIVCLMHIFD